MIESEKVPFVSVVVPCRNENEHIDFFAASLLNQDYPEDRMEVIIADGMSDNGTRKSLEAICRQHRQIKLIDNPQKIVPTGLNAAIRKARGEIIIRMDMHTEYAPDYISRCVETLLSTGAANVGGPARTRAESFMQKVISAAYHSHFAVGGSSFHFEDHQGEVDTVPYGCWYKKTLLEIGLFDEELVKNQDDELNLRLRKAGYRIWQNPAIFSWYHPRESLPELFREYYEYGFWKVRVIRKHGRPASLRHLVPASFIIALSASAFAALLRPGLWMVPLAIMSVYAGFVFIGAALTSAKSRLMYFPVLPFVFAAFHFGYGCGFLRGLIGHPAGVPRRSFHR